ncbi:hypothetical protein Glove_212g114 [Diversispora epigaea]|uniref:Zinc-ribbon domain-containing protein n=1 Tax=Diversispora epigaea TaxID=1348612 RepID=A0A397ISH0_9GLOM|nr:hypothetical protein Glove_212g114 [Diversispora epigaea]
MTATSTNYKTHPQAIYTSRLLNFSNLPKPKNDENFEKKLEELTESFYINANVHYINCEIPLQWRCAKVHEWSAQMGHTWYANLNHVKNTNTWCPYCSKYRRENLCREIVTKYLGPPSKIRRPDFLKTPEYSTV